MHLGLLVARLIIAKIGVLLQSLANAAHNAVTKNTEAPGEEWLFHSIAFNILVLQKCDHGL